MTTTLCLDIGSGTQDVLLHIPGREIENCPKFILPTPSVRIAGYLSELTAKKTPVWLHGCIMGGGIGGGVKKHLEAGLPLAATRQAALTLNDDPAKVEAMGVTLTEDCPDGYRPLELLDFDDRWWNRFLDAAELPRPDRVAACAQDHGHHPGTSNRLGRFKIWEELLTEHHGDPAALIYETPPTMMTRLRDLHESANRAVTADSGSAAVLGALFDPEIERRAREQGMTLVNIGNSHTIAFLLHGGRIHGVYEQHTGCLNPEKLWQDLDDFRHGRLTFQQVFDEWGHGCLTLATSDKAGAFPETVVIGPRRAMLHGYDASFPAPGGDMMLTGCFGLIKGMEMLGLEDRA
ncbi:DUF1786 domain-containing protein [Salidesulfovibrio brasiliensis]